MSNQGKELHEACAQRSRVGHREDALKALDFGDGLLGVYSVSICRKQGDISNVG
jgi:hypothetical protein